MQLRPTTFHEDRSKNPEIVGRSDRPELAGYHARRLTLLRAQQVAKDRSLDPTLWPSIEKGRAHCPSMAL